MVFIVLMGGSKTESHVSVATNSVLYEPQMIDKCMWNNGGITLPTTSLKIVMDFTIFFFSVSLTSLHIISALFFPSCCVVISA
jgi:hypothetical protein